MLSPIKLLTYHNPMNVSHIYIDLVMAYTVTIFPDVANMLPFLIQSTDYTPLPILGQSTKVFITF